MERAFLVFGAAFGLVGVMFGAFGSHALRSKLPPARLATFETGVRYQMWHALGLFAVVFIGSIRFVSRIPTYYASLTTPLLGRSGRRAGCSSPGSSCSRAASTS